MPDMTVSIRLLQPEETRTFLEVHHAAVRGLATDDYEPRIINSWAPLPITDEAVKRAMSNPENEIRLVAMQDDAIVGMAAVIPPRHELRACYVLPEAARKGVGSALVRAMEHIAREHHAGFLELDSSLTAEPFYARLGYRVLDRGTHVLSSGCAMPCVRMRMDLSIDRSGQTAQNASR